MSRRFARELPGHDVKTTQQMGWRSIRNGALLALAAGQFDVFVTVDSNMSYQQNVKSLPLPIIVLRAKSLRLAHLKPLAPELRKVLETVPTEPVTVIGPP